MAHPYAEHRQQKVERSRVGRMTGGYAGGGHADAPADRKMIRSMVKPGALKMDGAKAGGRLDKRARGGGVNRRDGGSVSSGNPVEQIYSKGQAGGGYANIAGQTISVPAGISRSGANDLASKLTTARGQKSGGKVGAYAQGGPVKKGATNVNVIIAPQGGAAAPPMVPPPLPAGPPPMPPEMPPMGQRRGGRAYASGGKVSDGPTWKGGLRNGTQVQHSDGKNDGGDIYRGRPITYATGGKIEAMGMGPKMKAGADSGEGRLEKTALQKRGKRT